MTKQDKKLEFYVLNYNFNSKKIEYFNIFRNIHVKERTLKEIAKYIVSPSEYSHTSYEIDKPAKVLYGFEAFCEELRCIIMGEEWGRCEYEISVGNASITDTNALEKWDCYQQALPNIKTIARDIIHQYKVM